MPVVFDAAHDDTAVHSIDGSHEQERHQYACACSQCAAGSSGYSPLHPAGLIRRHLQGSQLCLNQQISGADTDYGIGDLLQYLGHGSLHHTFMGLKITPQHSQDSIDEDGGRKCLQHGNRVLRHKKTCAEIKHQAGYASHCQHITDGPQKYPVGVAVLFHSQSLGYDL